MGKVASVECSCSGGGELTRRGEQAPIRSGTHHPNHPLTGHCCLLPQSPRMLISGSQDRTARLWDLSSDDLTLLRLKGAQILYGHSGCIYSLSLSPCGRRLATSR